MWRCNFWTQMKDWNLNPYRCGLIIMQLCKMFCDHKEIENTGDEVVDKLVKNFIPVIEESLQRYIDKVNAINLEREISNILSQGDSQDS